MSTPIFLAYTGSSACSASMKPAMPPIFCTSAIICRVTVVLPLDSGPYISTILPLGIPPSPRAMSRLKEPVGTVSTFIREEGSPSFITAPLPNCFSIWPMAASNAFNFSSLSIWNLLFLQEQTFSILRIKHSFAFVNYILCCLTISLPMKPDCITLAGSIAIQRYAVYLISSTLKLPQRHPPCLEILSETYGEAAGIQE